MLDVKEEEEEEDREEVKIVFRNHEQVLVLLLLLLLLLLYSALETCSTDRTPTMLVAPTPNSRRLPNIRNIFLTFISLGGISIKNKYSVLVTL